MSNPFIVDLPRKERWFSTSLGNKLPELKSPSRLCINLGVTPRCWCRPPGVTRMTHHQSSDGARAGGMEKRKGTMEKDIGNPWECPNRPEKSALYMVGTSNNHGIYLEDHLLLWGLSGHVLWNMWSQNNAINWPPIFLGMVSLYHPTINGDDWGMVPVTLFSPRKCVGKWLDPQDRSMGVLSGFEDVFCPQWLDTDGPSTSVPPTLWLCQNSYRKSPCY